MRLPDGTLVSPVVLSLGIRVRVAWHGHLVSVRDSLRTR